MNEETKRTRLGELRENVEANQIGLLSLFREEGIPVYMNADGSYSSAAIYQGILSGEKDTSSRLNDLELGSQNGSRKFNGANITAFGSDGATISYKTILKVTVILAVLVGLFFLLRHYYRKMK